LRARNVKAGLRPGKAGVARAAQLGGWLFVRTISLRVAFVGATVVATRLGTDQLAAWHVAFTVFSLLALALDCLAIASQALVGHQLGAGDRVCTRQVVSRTVWWGLWGGLALGVVLAASAPLVPLIVTSDAAVRDLLVPTLLVLALAMPLGGYVFVLDGVLMGAGDGRYLALTGVLNALVVLPLFALTLNVAEVATPSWVGLAVLQASVGVGYLGARALTLGLRVRRDRWMVLGVNA
ncbi:MAG: MATE family efflux transporter, partial [Pontimonas sp.]